MLLVLISMERMVSSDLIEISKFFQLLSSRSFLAEIERSLISNVAQNRITNRTAGSVGPHVESGVYGSNLNVGGQQNLKLGQNQNAGANNIYTPNSGSAGN